MSWGDESRLWWVPLYDIYSHVASTDRPRRMERRSWAMENRIVVHPWIYTHADATGIPQINDMDVNKPDTRRASRSTWKYCTPCTCELTFRWWVQVPGRTVENVEWRLYIRTRTYVFSMVQKFTWRGILSTPLFVNRRRWYDFFASSIKKASNDQWLIIVAEEELHCTCVTYTVFIVVPGTCSSKSKHIGLDSSLV
jgi:hypothetical protein